MYRVPMLPKWMLPSLHPSLYDHESATAIEMVSKLYGAMQSMIEDYNKFTDEINKEIKTFTGSSSEEIDNFKKSIEQRLICKFNDLDARYNAIRVDMQRYTDERVNETYEQYLNGQMSQLISEKIAAGEIDITLVYDPETESLNLTTGGE